MSGGIDVVFLGTGGSLPTKERGLPSVALRRDGELILLDCGEGTQRQMIVSAYGFSVLEGFRRRCQGSSWRGTLDGS